MVFGPWQDHVKSFWTQNRNHVLFLKYEDLKEVSWMFISSSSAAAAASSEIFIYFEYEYNFLERRANQNNKSNVSFLCGHTASG